MINSPDSTLQSLCAIILNNCSGDLDSLQFVARSLWLMSRDRAANRDELEDLQESASSEAQPKDREPQPKRAQPRVPRMPARTARATPATSPGDAAESSAFPGPPGLDFPSTTAPPDQLQPAGFDGQPAEPPLPDLVMHDAEVDCEDVLAGGRESDEDL
jgi:hypothetical protein